MPANQNPIFTLTPHIGWGSVDDNSSATAGPMLTANTAMDGTGYVTPVFTAGSNGSYIQKMIIRPVGTNSSASVLRIFLNNGLTNATQANNVLINEVSLPTATATAVASMTPLEVPLNYAIPAGYVINCTLGTTIQAGVRVCCVAGDY